MTLKTWITDNPVRRRWILTVILIMLGIYAYNDSIREFGFMDLEPKTVSNALALFAVGGIGLIWVDMFGKEQAEEESQPLASSASASSLHTSPQLPPIQPIVENNSFQEYVDGLVAGKRKQ